MKYISLIILSTLIFLGSWQVSRWKHKQEILHRINQPSTVIPTNITKDYNYTKVYFTHLTLNNQKLIYMYAGTRGYYVLTVGRLENNKLALINLGNIKIKHQTSIPQNINLTGIILFNSRKPILISNYDETSDIWFSFDQEGMSEKLATKLEPYIVWVEHANIKGINNNGVFTVHNRHLEYIITWYSLAFILLCYLIYGYRKQAKTLN